MSWRSVLQQRACWLTVTDTGDGTCDSWSRASGEKLTGASEAAAFVDRRLFGLQACGMTYLAQQRVLFAIELSREMIPLLGRGAVVELVDDSCAARVPQQGGDVPLHSRQDACMQQSTPLRFLQGGCPDRLQLVSFMGTVLSEYHYEMLRARDEPVMAPCLEYQTWAPWQ